MRYIEVGETDSTLLQAYFDVRLLDGSPALSEAGGQPEYNINGGSFNPVGIGTLVIVQYGRYYARLTSTILTTPGDVIRTRYKSGATLECFGDTFLVTDSESDLPTDSPATAYYGSVDQGDFYFNNSLRGARWKKSSVDQKRRALIDATRIVDSLNYAGDRASYLQILQFPRSNSYLDPVTFQTTATQDVNVPDDVKIATYLIADKLLEGWDPDIERDSLSVTGSKFSGASTTYQRNFIPEHKVAGVPSAVAWALLKPYIRDPREVVMTRM